MTDKNKVVITITIDPDLLELVEEKARKEERSRSQTIERAVREELEREQEEQEKGKK
jgi:metal-responsive CopG/Arc/MetJ family transcriptional regulator